MPKDPCEVGSAKLFLSEIFSGMSTQAEVTSEPEDQQVTWPSLQDGSFLCFQLRCLALRAFGAVFLHPA